MSDFLYDNTNLSTLEASNITLLVFDDRIVINSVTPSTFSDGTTGIVVDGNRFQTTGNTYLDASALADPTVTGVAQTETARSSSQITFTCVQGGLSAGTVYLYVTNSAGDWGTPFACTLTATGVTPIISPLQQLGSQFASIMSSRLNGNLQ